MNRIIKRMAIPLSAAAVLGTAGFAYMAANSNAPSYAGSGTSNVSGYTVSPIHFNTFPAYGGDAYVGSIEFTLNHSADPANVTAYIDSEGDGTAARFTSCTSTNAPTDTAFKCLPTAHPENLVVSQVTKVIVTATQ